MKKDYSPLDNAILDAIKSGITELRKIDSTVKEIAKPFRPYTGEYDEWPTKYIVSCRLAYLRHCGAIINTKGNGWKTLK